MDRTDTPFTCQDVSERLIDYHYDELPATERGRVARHLARCGDCARAYCALHADLLQYGCNRVPAIEQVRRERVEVACDGPLDGGEQPI